MIRLRRQEAAAEGMYNVVSCHAMRCVTLYCNVTRCASL